MEKTDSEAVKKKKKLFPNDWHNKKTINHHQN